MSYLFNNCNLKLTLFKLSSTCPPLLSVLLDMPQKVRHFLGHFLWEEKRNLH